MSVRHYRAILRRKDDGSYGVVFPELPGCISGGDDADDAALKAAEARALHLGAMIEDGDPIPPPAPLDAPLPDWLSPEAATRTRLLVEA
jgi:predicted RNase H-like HicB family nuclease